MMTEPAARDSSLSQAIHASALKVPTAEARAIPNRTSPSMVNARLFFAYRESSPPMEHSHMKVLIYLPRSFLSFPM